MKKAVVSLIPLTVAFLSLGCAEEQPEVTSTPSAALEAAPSAPEETLRTVSASEETFESLGVRSFTLYATEADDMVGVRALGGAGETKAVFELRAYDASGAAAESPQEVSALEIRAAEPGGGARRISLKGEVTADTFPPNAFETKVAVALDRDFSTFGALSHPAARPSLDSSLRFQVGGPGCYTKTSCVIAVMMCTDQCCNGFTTNNESGLPQATDCRKLKDEYVCGACFAPGNGEAIKRAWGKIKGWFK